MKAKKRSDRPQIHGLHCRRCGNRDRFIQIMDYETHLVDRNMNYLHLLDAIVESYRCYFCGASIPKHQYAATL